MTIGDIKQNIANYLKQAIANFTINGEDMLLLALNNARRTAERLNDFYNSQINAYLQVPLLGGNLVNAVVPASVAPITVGPLVIGSTYQILTLVAGDNFTNVGAVNATGYIFKATGTTPTTWTNGSTLQLQTVLNLKTVDNVLLPISGAYLPIEFLDQETWVERVRRQAGRSAYNPASTLTTIGLNLTSAIAIQQGQTIYVYPSTGAAITYPIIVQLDSIMFLPDYTGDANTDYFTTVAPEYLMWQGIIEGNKLWDQFVAVQEGVVNEESVQQMAQFAFESLITWDRGVGKGTTAKQKPFPQLAPPPRQRAEPKAA